MNLLKNKPATGPKLIVPHAKGDLNDQKVHVQYQEIGPEIRTNEEGESHYYFKITNHFQHCDFGTDFLKTETEYIVKEKDLSIGMVKSRGWIFGLDVSSLEVVTTVSGSILDYEITIPFQLKGSNTSTVRLFDQVPIILSGLLQPVNQLSPYFTKEIENSFKAVEAAIREDYPELKARQDPEQVEVKKPSLNVKVSKTEEVASPKQEVEQKVEEPKVAPPTELASLMADYEALLKGR